MRDILLKAPLNRGRIEAKAGETVSVPHGLARRLIERGRATDPEAAAQAEPQPTEKAAKVPAPNAKAKPAKGDDKTE